MNPLRRISPVPKLAMIFAFSTVLMAGAILVVILNLSYNKAM
jgi:uncharacterized protein involved in exopolysaccharide biosynthesis